MAKELIRESYKLKVFNFVPVIGVGFYLYNWLGSCAVSPDDNKTERRFAALGLYNAVLLSSAPLIRLGLERLVS